MAASETTGPGRPSWQQIKPLLAQVLDRPADERMAMVERLSAGDAAMRSELLSLLTAFEADDAALQAIPTAFALQALHAQFDASLTGQRVGAWQLTSLIARGGQGEVYRAERADGQFVQHAAIKLLRSGFDREWLASRFAAERQILASLDHPNLARLLDGGTSDDGVPFIVMELVEGESIDRYCTRRALPLAQRLALFRTVCQVVGYAHGKGIVHRDLKCDNILVTAEGVVKLVDFGIAKQLSADSQTTATAQRMMTLAYSSPEQVRGEHVTPASDVYSLGVVLYRLLTEASPYVNVTADAGYELTRAICETEPPPPSRVQAQTSPKLTSAQRRRMRGDLDAVVMMALRKNPARRYASATEFGEDIFRHQESLPVHARRGALSYRAQRFLLRHRALAAAAAFANLALIAGLGMAVWQGVEADRQRQRAEQERERAERSVATMREFANVVIFDVHEAIQELPGSTAARQIVVDRGLAYLQKVEGEVTDKKALQLEIAGAYRKMAEIQNNPFVANLGDPAGSRQSATRALSLYEQALGRRELDASTRRQVELDTLKVLRLLARLKRNSGDPRGARELLIRATAMFESYREKGAVDVDAAIAVSGVYTTLSQIDASEPEEKVALDWLNLAQRTLDPFAESEHANADWLRARSQVHLTWAQMYFLRDGASGGDAKIVRSLAELDEARSVQDRLLKLRPTSLRTMRDIAAIEANRGVALERLNRVPEAIVALDAGRATNARLVELDPTNQNARGDLAMSESQLGSVLIESGNVGRGLPHVDAAIALFEELNASGRLDQGRLGSLADAYLGRGDAYGKQASGQRGQHRRQLMADACRMYAKGGTMARQLDQSRGQARGLVERAADRLKRCP